MKLLLFSDSHGNINFIKNLWYKSKDADLTLCAGDISNFGTDLSMIMSKLNSFKNPVLVVHGNHEEPDELREACKENDNIIFLHKAVHISDDYFFMGYGGGGFNMLDTDFTLVANRFFKRQGIEKMKKTILMTHAPPFKTRLDLVQGEHRGNKSIRNFIDEVSPHLVVCGHLHENAGKEQLLGKTFIVNPGPEGMIVDI
ncbi:MAG: metallophosphoesterase family protein [Nanoarchaeota archaeon]|nr:metallophosphoesterase family protein [Nanoarchaeota archaeon]